MEQATSTRVYKFGIHAKSISDESRSIMQDQLWKNYRYYNNLIKLKRDAYTFSQQQEKELSPVIADLYAQLESINTKLTPLCEERKKLSRSERDTFSGKSAIDALKKERTAIYKMLSKERKVVCKQFFEEGNLKYKELKEKISEEEKIRLNKAKLGPNGDMIRINEDVNKRLLEDPSITDAWKARQRFKIDQNLLEKDLRSKSAISSGSYVQIESAVKEATADSFQQPKFKKVKETITGAITLQLQGNVTFEDLVKGSCGKCKIVGLETIYNANGRRPKSRCNVLFIIGDNSGEKRKELIINVPVEFHRSLPSDAIILYAKINVSNVGYRPVYELQFTVKSSQFVKPTGDGKLAVDIHTERNENGEVIVATTWDGRESNEFILPREIEEKLKYANHVEHITDKIYDGVVDLVANCVQTNAVFKDLLQTTLTDMYKEKAPSVGNIRQWKNPARLVKFVKTLIHNINWIVEPGTLWHDWSNGDKANGVLPGYISIGDRFPCTEVDRFMVPNVAPLYSFFVEQCVTDSVQQLILILHFWTIKHKHLVDIYSGLRKKALNRRNTLYRMWVAKQAKKYSEVIIGYSESKLKNTKKKKINSDGEAVTLDNTVKLSRIAASHILKNNLADKFKAQKNVVGREEYNKDVKFLFDRKIERS